MVRTSKVSLVMRFLIGSPGLCCQRQCYCPCSIPSSRYGACTYFVRVRIIWLFVFCISFPNCEYRWVWKQWIRLEEHGWRGRSGSSCFNHRRFDYLVNEFVKTTSFDTLILYSEVYMHVLNTFVNRTYRLTEVACCECFEFPPCRSQFKPRARIHPQTEGAKRQ